MTKTAPTTLAQVANDGAHFGAFAPILVPAGVVAVAPLVG